MNQDSSVVRDGFLLACKYNHSSIIKHFVTDYTELNITTVNKAIQILQNSDDIDVLLLDSLYCINRKEFFYYCYQNGFLDIARKIYQTGNFDIFILFDVFKYEMYSPDLENVRGLIDIRCEKHSYYSFLSSEEEYFRNLEKIMKVTQSIDEIEL